MARRNEVRQKAVQMIIAKAPGCDVVDSSLVGYEPRDLPIIVIYVLNEDVLDTLSIDPLLQRVAMGLSVQILVAEPELSEIVPVGPSALNTMEDLAAIVESALDYTLGGIAEGCLYDGFTAIPTEQAEFPGWMGILSYKVHYIYQGGVTDVSLLAPISAIHINYDRADVAPDSTVAPDGVFEATDRVIFT